MSAPRRLEVDAVLRCPTCHTVPYRVWRRQNAQPDGQLLETFHHVVWPVAGGSPVPPEDPMHPRCPSCGTELRREAP